MVTHEQESCCSRNVDDVDASDFARVEFILNDFNLAYKIIKEHNL